MYTIYYIPDVRSRKSEKSEIATGPLSSLAMTSIIALLCTLRGARSFPKSIVACLPSCWAGESRDIERHWIPATEPGPRVFLFLLYAKRYALYASMQRSSRVF